MLRILSERRIGEVSKLAAGAKWIESINAELCFYVCVTVFCVVSAAKCFQSADRSLFAAVSVRSTSSDRFAITSCCVNQCVVFSRAVRPYSRIHCLLRCFLALKF